MKNNYQRNIIDRFERNRQRQKLIYESYDSKLKNSNFSLDNKTKGNLERNKGNNNNKMEKEKLSNVRLSKTKSLNKTNNLLPKFQQDFSFEKIFCSNNRITKDDIINFEKNEENIFLNLLKGIEQLNNGKFRINASQILKKEKYSKEKQSITTKESETINNSDKNNNTSKSLNTNRTLSKRNLKDKNLIKKVSKELRKEKKIIKIVFPQVNNSKKNIIKKDSPIKIKYQNKFDFNDLDFDKPNLFTSERNNKIKIQMNDSSLLDISSIKSNGDSTHRNSKINISIQKSILDFIK